MSQHLKTSVTEWARADGFLRSMGFAPGPKFQTSTMPGALCGVAGTSAQATGGALLGLSDLLPGTRALCPASRVELSLMLLGHTQPLHTLHLTA